MIHTFKFEPTFSPSGGLAPLGKIPAGQILESRPVFEDGKPYWLIVVDDDPQHEPPAEHYHR